MHPDAVELARHGISVLGVDVDPAMLATARKLAPALSWVEGDLATVPLPPAAFDVAASNASPNPAATRAMRFLSVISVVLS